MSDPISPMPPVEVVPFGKIKPFKRNPRVITNRAIEMTAGSLREFGWKQPMVLDDDYELVVGHTRFLAAKSLGAKAGPAIFARDLTPDQVKAYRIVDNRTRDYTTWDLPELTVQLEELGPEFADVLGLADWEGILDTFNNLDLDVSDEDMDALTEKYVLTVVCETEEAAKAAAALIIDMPGVTDVRDKRKSA